MTGESIIDVQELLDKAGDAEGREMLRVLLAEVLQAVLEAERDEHVGVGRYERSDERRDTRSGYKPRTVSTLVGDLELLTARRSRSPFYPPTQGASSVSQNATQNH